MMKKKIILGFLSSLIILSCASTKLSNNQNLIYSTNFNSDEEIFSKTYHGGTIEIVNGMLHMKANQDGECGSFKPDIWFGNNSVVSFKIKLGEKIVENHPKSHINFFADGHNFKTRFCIMIDDNGIGTFTWINGKDIDIDRSYSQKKFAKNKLYDIKISIQNNKLKLFINGIPFRTYKLNKELPEEGNLLFECHQEYWIDDLKISQITSND